MLRKTRRHQKQCIIFKRKKKRNTRFRRSLPFFSLGTERGDVGLLACFEIGNQFGATIAAESRRENIVRENQVKIVSSGRSDPELAPQRIYSRSDDKASHRVTIRPCSRDMFTIRGLFRDVPCPSGCNHSFCLFSHVTPQDSVPAKRSAPDQVSRPSSLPRQTPSSSSHPENAERPTKLQRVGSVKRPVAVPTASSSSTVSLAL